MKIAYFDCFCGISGDMVLGALLDIGVKLDYIKGELKKLNLNNYEIKAYKTRKSNITGTKVDVLLNQDDKVHRNLKDIEEIINSSSLGDKIKDKGLQIFRRMAEAEAKIHNINVDKVHFHEIGAIDSIVDVIGSLVGIHSLDLDKICSSPLNVGRGMVTTEHGELPVPAPATLELLKGIPIYTASIEHELTTPTGAAIISSLAQDFGDLSSIEVEKIGYGAGFADFDHTPNLLRLIVGKSFLKWAEDNIDVLEANIDDMNPEFYDYILERFFEQGALDVFFTPIIMKKNRPGIKITVLLEEKDLSDIQKVFFYETSTFGLRSFKVKRNKLIRDIIKIQTELGEIRIKVGKEDNNVINISPEYEDCKKIARDKEIPLKDVFQKAINLARKRLKLD